MTAWTICGVVVGARQNLRDGVATGEAGHAEAFQREATSLYSELLAAPEATLQNLANDKALIAAGPDAIREFVALSARLSELAVTG